MAALILISGVDVRLCNENQVAEYSNKNCIVTLASPGKSETCILMVTTFCESLDLS